MARYITSACYDTKIGQIEFLLYREQWEEKPKSGQNYILRVVNENKGVLPVAQFPAISDDHAVILMQSKIVNWLCARCCSFEEPISE